MAEPLYVVTGATGNVGKEVALTLLAAGKRVRVIGRTADRLKDFTAKGAEAAVGSLEDAAFTAKAFEGAKGVFAMIPPNYGTNEPRAYQLRIVEALAKGIESAKPTHVVTLSSIGANLSKGNGPVASLYALEQRLAKIPGLNVLNLRPGYFMENLLANIGMIKGMNLNGGPMRGDLAIPMIAARDIGPVAGKRLAALDFQGQSVLELQGQRDVPLQEATRLIGAAIGKPQLPYVQFPYPDAQKAMVGAGLPPAIADDMIELNKGFNDGAIERTQPRSAQTTTPTSIEEFVKTTFAGAFKGS